MDIGIISVRYARALYKFALERNEEHVVYNEMESIANVYMHEPELRLIIENPSLSLDQKENILVLSAGTDASESTKRFVKLVVSKQRANLMQFIASSYLKLYLQEKHIVKSRLIAPIELSQELTAKLCTMVERRTGSKVNFTVEKDPTIDGGFILEYGTYRIDATINNQIKRIRQQLLSNNNVLPANQI